MSHRFSGRRRRPAGLLALLATLLVLPALGAAPAQARPGTAPEPVVVIPGLGENCVSSRYDDADNPVLAGAVATSLTRVRAAAGSPVEAVPASWVHGWRFSACWRTLRSLAKQLDRSLAAVQARHGGRPVDVLSFSFGGTIARWCFNDPMGDTPGCRARVDDWVGVVAASGGTTKANLPACLTAGLVGLGSICQSLSYNSRDIRRINRGDGTPAPIEHTVMWSAGDEFLKPVGSERLDGAANVQLFSRHGRVSHAGTWIGGPCSTVPDLAAAALLDLAPHVPGDAVADCNVAPDGTLVPPPPPLPRQNTGPGAPSVLDGASATSRMPSG